MNARAFVAGDAIQNAWYYAEHCVGTYIEEGPGRFAVCFAKGVRVALRLHLPDLTSRA